MAVLRRQLGCFDDVATACFNNLADAEMNRESGVLQTVMAMLRRRALTTVSMVRQRALASTVIPRWQPDCFDNVAMTCSEVVVRFDGCGDAIAARYLFQ